MQSLSKIIMSFMFPNVFKKHCRKSLPGIHYVNDMADALGRCGIAEIRRQSDMVLPPLNNRSSH